ncbi:hypothetical protein D1013_10960 [Euzebyella marina]|uniref:Uncharacterized protein n=1 Tax=Euzebyella marina TaxID=1761453 RepID=A0A3G2L6J3_9FLAO|nr:DUF6095 family protein [Euzebyella marina]AYN67856.1 hypothetical protein D1013_10960 [Euzebyella marina]
MKTDKELLVKGIKFLAYTLVLMFMAPVVLYQAFKNQENILFWPVLIIGLVLAVGAIAMGFYSIKVLLDSLFGPGKKKD